MYTNFASLIHACCVFFIVSGLKSKPLGTQTLVDLVMTNTLILQCINTIGHVLILNWALSMSSPRNDIICATFTIVISHLTLCHTLFLLLNVLTKYVCVFYSTYQEMVQDSQVIKTMWIFVIVASTTFVPLEFIFAHEIQSMNTYKELKVSEMLNRIFLTAFTKKINYWYLTFDFSKQLNWSAKQEDGYFLRYIFLLTVISYICLELKIKITQRLNFDPFFDFYNCLGYFLFFIVYGVFVLYNEPIIESLPTRAFLQITFADIVLMRLILKSHTFRDHILSMIRFNPRMFELISWAMKSINSLPYAWLSIKF